MEVRIHCTMEQLENAVFLVDIAHFWLFFQASKLLSAHLVLLSVLTGTTPLDISDSCYVIVCGRNDIVLRTPLIHV